MAVLDIDNLALNDIDVGSITNESGTGVFDKLMEAVNNNILAQYNANRITNSDYATVYLGSLQAVLTQSIQFVLQEQVSEAQIGGMLKDNELKAKQLEMANVEKLIKQYQLDNILPKELALKSEQISSSYTERLVADKQAAKLGLDNVMKKSEASRDSDVNFVYVPNYVAP